MRMQRLAVNASMANGRLGRKATWSAQVEHHSQMLRSYVRVSRRMGFAVT